MRLLIAINVRWWNAEAAYALNVARAFMENNIPVWVVADKGSPVFLKARKANIPLLEGVNLSSNSPITQWKNYRRLKQFILENRINVINSFKSSGSFLFTLLRNHLPQLTFCKTRGEASPPKKNIFNRYLYSNKGCDGIIAAGKQVEQWVRDLNIGQQKMKTIYFCDYPLKERVGEMSEETAEKLSFAAGGKVVALVGRTQPVKGHLVALQAFLSLKEKDLHLLFLVKDLEEYPQELRELYAFIAENNLQAKVTVSGFQASLARVLENVDIGIIPSLGSEINCRMVVEFFSMGIPLVVFPTGTLPEVVKHGQNGYVCKEKTAEDLKRGIEWITKDPELVPILGKKAFENYEERFTLRSLFEETSRFYLSLKELRE